MLIDVPPKEEFSLSLDLVALFAALSSRRLPTALSRPARGTRTFCQKPSNLAPSPRAQILHLCRRVAMEARKANGPRNASQASRESSPSQDQAATISSRVITSNPLVPDTSCQLFTRGPITLKLWRKLVREPLSETPKIHLKGPERLDETTDVSSAQRLRVRPSIYSFLPSDDEGSDNWPPDDESLFCQMANAEAVFTHEANQYMTGRANASHNDVVDRQGIYKTQQDYNEARLSISAESNQAAKEKKRLPGELVMGPCLDEGLHSKA